VVARERLAEAREDLERRGLPAFLHATLGDLDLTFHDAASLTGHHMELHADSQGFRDFFRMVQRASVGWDGSDPLRSPTDGKPSEGRGSGDSPERVSPSK
jgi:hypothetical protein